MIFSYFFFLTFQIICISHFAILIIEDKENKKKCKKNLGNKFKKIKY